MKIRHVLFGCVLLSNQAWARDSVPVPSDYESWSGCAKQEWLWEKMEESEYETLPTWGPFNIISLVLSNLDVTMERQSDVMPKGREKVIHAQGSVAKVAFVSTMPQAYTGLFFSGSSCALARLSLAVNPEQRGVIPGLALKFLVDGRPSRNTQLMHSLDGQGQDYNYFRHAFTNVLPEPRDPALQALKLIFARGSRHPLRLGLDHMAAVNEQGAAAFVPLAPYELIVKPTAEAQFPAHPKRPVQQDFATLPAGTTLYTVHVRANAGEREEQIGFIRTTSRFVASKFGDEHLFFHHKRYRDE